jgi:uncharacterized protein YhaN
LIETAGEMPALQAAEGEKGIDEAVARTRERVDALRAEVRAMQAEVAQIRARIEAQARVTEEEAGLAVTSPTVEPVVEVVP